MALWQIGNRTPSKASDFSGSSEGAFKIVYPNADGSTGGIRPNWTAPIKSNNSNDIYGGTPINITSGNSAQGLDSISYQIGNGFEGLMNLIQQNTDKNNAWSAAQAQRQMDFQERMNSIAMDFNSNEAAKNRDWQEYMSSSAHQREVADLKAAGLNPVLSASGGNGAAVTSGATASGVTSAGAKGDTDESANAALTSLYGALINSQTQMYNANLSARTNLAIAEKQAAASMYGAQLSAETARANSPMQIVNAVLDGVASYMGNPSTSAGKVSTPAQRTVSAVQSAVNDAVNEYKNDPNFYKKSSYEDSRNYLKNSKLGKMLGW